MGPHAGPEARALPPVEDPRAEPEGEEAGERGLHCTPAKGDPRALHRQRSWDSASLLLLGKDPCERNPFEGMEAELEAIVGYREALKKLQKGGQFYHEEKPGGGAPPKKGDKGDGKGKDKGKDNKNKEATDGGVGL